jgi:hypothetical protein
MTSVRPLRALHAVEDTEALRRISASCSNEPVPVIEVIQTGSAVVSRCPQSTTRPVIRPIATKHSNEVGANDTEGTYMCYYQFADIERQQEDSLEDY